MPLTFPSERHLVLCVGVGRPAVVRARKRRQARPLCAICTRVCEADFPRRDKAKLRDRLPEALGGMYDGVQGSLNMPKEGQWISG